MSGNRINIDTSEYQFIHGKQPGGKGFWIFTLEGGPESGTTVSHYGSYGEALKRAKKKAISIGAHTVVVGS